MGIIEENSSKTVLFEPNEINEDGKDETNLSTPTIENDQLVDPENDTRPNIVIDQDLESKPLPPKPKPSENRLTPDLNQDDIKNQHPTQSQTTATTTATTTTTANNFFSIDELEQHIKNLLNPVPQNPTSSMIS